MLAAVMFEQVGCYILHSDLPQAELACVPSSVAAFILMKDSSKLIKTLRVYAYAQFCYRTSSRCF
jgi:hypothetical protein